jgi:hypothetical protein
MNKIYVIEERTSAGTSDLGIFSTPLSAIKWAKIYYNRDKTDINVCEFILGENTEEYEFVKDIFNGNNPESEPE